MAEQAVSIDKTSAPAAVALAGLAALAVAIGIGRFAFTPVLPMMREDAALSVVGGGWLASANYAGYLLGALWAAAQPVRAAVAIRAGLAAIGLATLGMSLDVGVAGWLALRFVAGVARAWVLIHVSAACLGRLASLRQPVLEGAVFSGVGVGIVVAGLLCAALTSAHAGSATAWRDLGLLSLGATLVIWNAFDPSPEAVRTSRPQRRWSGAHIRLAFAYGAFGFGYIIPATFIPVLARELIGDPASFGWAWPVFGAAAAGSTLAMTFAAKRLSARTLWAAAQLVMAFGVSAPVVWPGSMGIDGRHAGGETRSPVGAGQPDGRDDGRLRNRAGHRSGARKHPGRLFHHVAGRLRGPGRRRLRALDSGRSLMSDRMPPLAEEAMNEEQRQAAAELAAGPRGGVRGPFIPLLRSPELMRCLQKVGEVLRYRSSLAPKLNELVMLIVAREWTQQFEWQVHLPLAIEVGLDPQIAVAVAEGRRPRGLAEDEALAWDFCNELMRARGVSDATYARAVALLGERGLIDLLGLVGYFTTVSMIMNVARTPPPRDAQELLLRAFPL